MPACQVLIVLDHVEARFIFLWGCEFGDLSIFVLPKEKTTNVKNHLQELIGRIGLQDFELLLALPEAGECRYVEVDGGDVDPMDLLNGGGFWKELSCGDMLVPITISRVPLKSWRLNQKPT